MFDMKMGKIRKVININVKCSLSRTIKDNVNNYMFKGLLYHGLSGAKGG